MEITRAAKMCDDGYADVVRAAFRCDDSYVEVVCAVYVSVDGYAEVVRADWPGHILLLVTWGALPSVHTPLSHAQII